MPDNTQTPQTVFRGVCNCLGVPSVKSADDRAGMRAAFITAADPQTIRALIERLRKSEAERNQLQEKLDDIGYDNMERDWKD